VLRKYAIIASLIAMLLAGSLLVEFPKSSLVLSPEAVLKIYSGPAGNSELQKNSDGGSGSSAGAPTTTAPITVRDLAKEKGISALAKHVGIGHLAKNDKAQASHDEKSNHAKKRVIVHTEEEEELAEANGCREIHNAKSLKAFICDRDVVEELEKED
jgi:hypothetical protein